MVADGDQDSVMTGLGVTKQLLDCINIMDSGSATTLAGKEDAEQWIRQGLAQSVSPLVTSVRHIRGIGALSRVCLWLKFTLNIGGALVTFNDVPVLRGHRGLLLGNDFLGPGRTKLGYTSESGGTLTIRDENLVDRSLPVRFDVTRDDGLSFAASTFASATDFGPISADQRAEFTQQQEGAAEVENALKGVSPIGWVPETTVIPAWCERDIWIRVPELLVKARDVLLLPLEDDRRTDPGVLIAPSLQRVSADGYTRCRVINLQKKEVRLPLLTPLVRFQVDPRVYKIEYEYTTEEIITKINVGSDLSEVELTQLRQMLESRRALFRSTLGYAHPYKMKLNLRGVQEGRVKPPNATLRLRSPQEEEALRSEVQKQLKAGLLEPARSPFNAVPMLVKKPTKPGEPQAWRTVIDFRAVNQLLERDVYPLPNLEMNLSRLGKANWFSTADLLQGFHQVELADDGVSKEATAFGTPDGQFQYVRMPMGLASSPSTFMRLVDATLSGLPPGICLAYVDDIVVPTCGTFEDHMRDVGMVFDRLIEAGFAVRCDKMFIGLKEVPYLGFMVGAYGTRPMASKTQGILDMAVQDMWGNPGAAARYSGMLGFYGRFIPDLQNLLAPFHELKAKAAPTDHIIGKKGAGSSPPSLRFISSFEATRAALTRVTGLVRPDYTKPFYVHIDAASSCGIGGALMQRQDQDDSDSLMPVAFWSRRLQDEERGYDVREQECLALDQTLKKWRHYLLGAQVHLLTDHSSLQWLLSTPHPDGSRVAGWALNAQGYDLTIAWIPGAKNVVGDCLSRMARSYHPVYEEGPAGERAESLLERLESAMEKETIDAIGDTASEEAAAVAAVLTRSKVTRRAMLINHWQVMAHRIRRSTHIFSEGGGEDSSDDECDEGADCQQEDCDPEQRQQKLTMAVDIDTLQPAENNTNSLLAIQRRVGDSPRATFWSNDVGCGAAVATAAESGPIGTAQEVKIKPPTQLSREAKRVALLLMRRLTTGEIQVAVEECEGELVLPSTTTTKVTSGSFSYRKQMAQMLCNMQAPTNVLTALERASSFRSRRSSSVARCQFFVTVAPPATDFKTTGLQFVSLNEMLLTSLVEPTDSLFLRFVVRQLGFGEETGVETTGRLRYWEGSVDKVRHQLAVLTAETATLSVPHNEPVPKLPTIQEKPFGPAFCESTEDGTEAISLINQRLRSNPGLSLSVDLEGLLGGRRGHIDLMQLSVDAVEKQEQQLMFVFDTDNNGAAFLGQGSLRDILQDLTIPKVLHCSYGDCSSLYYEYDIAIQGVFDTGIADCLLRRAGAHRQRRLDKVIEEHVPGATLSLKGSFVHIPRMFAIRPLPMEYFIYAYEDVVHCNRLYVAMRDALLSEGLLEIALTLSTQRAPPIALPRADLRHQPATQVAVLLRDQTHMVCLQQTDGLLSIPCGQLESMETIRAQAAHVWKESVGTIPKVLAALFHSQMKKAIRVGDVMLVDVVVKDCHLLLAPLRDSADLAGVATTVGSLVVRPCCNIGKCTVPAVLEQRSLFQHIWVVNSPDTKAKADSAVVIGKTYTTQRAAIVVQDGTHVFCLTTSKPMELGFPSAPIELGMTAAESAIRAFDTFAGPSLNKQAGMVNGIAVMPVSSKQVRAGLAALEEIGTYGNTVFFKAYVPALRDLLPSFTASRMTINGFRLTATLSKRHPEFMLCSNTTAIERLTGVEQRAFADLRQIPLTAALSQHSGPVVARGEEDESIVTGWHELDEVLQSEALFVESNATETDRHIPDVGVDPEYDSLFEAAVLIQYVRLDGGQDRDAEVHTKEASTVGTPLTVTMPTIAEVREAQREHPATQPWVDYLESGEWSDTWQKARGDEDRAQLIKEVQAQFLDGTGVLRSRSTDNAEGLVIVPPKLRRRVIHQYHDRAGHFGVQKTLKLVSHRFYWGGVDIMRKDVADYIRYCEPCQLSKLPNHKAGEYQIGDCGQHANDVLCGDVYYVGTSEDGFDTTLDFACFFTRAITSIPMQGVPTSEEIMDALITHVIAHEGVPSEIRSDAGSNFISKAIRLLYERMGIKMKVGTAYHHQFVALVERWHRTLGQLLKTHRAAQQVSSWGGKWYRCVPLMQLAYNLTINRSTGYSPFFLQHLRHARMPSDLRRADCSEAPLDLPQWVQDRLDELNVVYDAATRSLRMNAVTAKKKYDLRHDVGVWFKAGDQVLLIKGTAVDSSAIKAKAELPVDGPFTVLRSLPHDRYVLSDLKTRRVRTTFHVSRLLPYFKHEEEEHRWMIGDAPGDATGGRWPVHSIVGRRVTTLTKRDDELGLPVGAQVLEYKIRWVGWTPSADRWRAIHYLGGILELINEYDRDHPFVPKDMMTDGLEIQWPRTTPSVIERPESAIPEASEEAKGKRHYRAHSNVGPRPQVDGELQEQEEVKKKGKQYIPEVVMEDADDVHRRLSESLARLPLQTRVRVHYGAEDVWHTGTVTKSWLPRWRVASKKPAHHVWVEYDDPSYPEPFEHNVQNSRIEVLEAEPTAEPPDDKKRRKMTRLQKELS